MGLTWGESVAASHRQWERKTGVLIKQAAETVANQSHGGGTAADSLGLVDLAKERANRAQAAHRSPVVDRLASGSKIDFSSAPVRHRERVNPFTRPLGTIEEIGGLSKPKAHRRVVAPAVNERNIVVSRPRERMVMVAHVHSTAMTPFSMKYFEH
jgi:hypothetical protein